MVESYATAALAFFEKLQFIINVFLENRVQKILQNLWRV